MFSAKTLTEIYNGKIDSKEINLDENQKFVVQQLELFEKSLREYDHQVQDDNVFSDVRNLNLI